MSAGGRQPDRTGADRMANTAGPSRRAQLVSGLRGLSKGQRNVAVAANGDAVAVNGELASDPADTERCDLCGLGIARDHRHLLALAERRIVCSCEACWAMRAGEGDYRPVGNRTLWLPELDVPDEVWANFQIPIGLAFFMNSTVTGCVVALYPSPAGATESELHFESWNRLLELNPVIEGLEPDIEGLIANRMSDPPAYAIAPIDRCYELTGTIKAHWEGISGGAGVEVAVAGFFDRLRTQAVAA